jgi:hypothetical protein
MTSGKIVQKFQRPRGHELQALLELILQERWKSIVLLALLRECDPKEFLRVKGNMEAPAPHRLVVG